MSEFSVYDKMFQPGSSFRARSTKWLVEGYLPLGNLSIFHGAGETAKSLLALHIAAKVSLGERLAFDRSPSPAAACDVLILAREDAVEETIIPRLVLAKANLRKIHFRAPGHDIRLPQDIKAVEWLIGRYNVKFVIIDTLDDFATKSTLNNQSARAVLNKLGDLAESKGVAILVICHWTKQRGSRGNLRNKIAGSFGILARGRCAYAFVPHPDDQGYLMISTKGNMGGRKPTVYFDVGVQPVEVDVRPVEGTDQPARGAGQFVDHPVILHKGFSTITEADFEGTTSKLDEAVAYLEDVLRTGPVDSKNVWHDAPAGRQTMLLAAKYMGIVISRTGQGTHHHSLWQLPDGYLDRKGGDPDGDGHGQERPAGTDSATDDHPTNLAPSENSLEERGQCSPGTSSEPPSPSRP